MQRTANEPRSLACFPTMEISGEIRSTTSSDRRVQRFERKQHEEQEDRNHQLGKSRTDRQQQQ